MTESKRQEITVIRKSGRIAGVKWNDRLLASQLVLTFLALFNAWALQYKSPDGNGSFISRISFAVVDPPWTPPGTFSNPILFLHHFGDWTIELAYSIFQRPYDPTLFIPSPTPPFGLVLLRIISVVGPKLSFAILTTVTVSLWWLVIYHFNSSRSLLGKFQILIFVVLLTLPSIFTFDRGAVHLFLFGLIGYSLAQYQRGKRLVPLVAFICAVSFKPYLIVLVLWLLRDRKYRQLIYTVAIAVGVNLISMAFYAGNIFNGLVDYIHAAKGYTSGFIIPWVLDSASFMGFLAKVNRGLFGSGSGENFLHRYIGFSWIFALIYILLLVILILDKNVPDFLIATLLLSIGSLIVPPAMEYTLVWASLAMIFVLSWFEENRYAQQFVEISVRTKNRLRVSYIACALLFLSVLTPYFGLFTLPSGAVLRQINTYLYVPLMLPVIICALTFSLYPARDLRINLELRVDKPAKSAKNFFIKIMNGL